MFIYFFVLHLLHTLSPQNQLELIEKSETFKTPSLQFIQSEIQGKRLIKEPQFIFQIFLFDRETSYNLLTSLNQEEITPFSELLLSKEPYKYKILMDIADHIKCQNWPETYLDNLFDRLNQSLFFNNFLLKLKKDLTSQLTSCNHLSSSHITHPALLYGIPTFLKYIYLLKKNYPPNISWETLSFIATDKKLTFILAQEILHSNTNHLDYLYDFFMGIKEKIKSPEDHDLFKQLFQHILKIINQDNKLNPSNKNTIFFQLIHLWLKFKYHFDELTPFIKFDFFDVFFIYDCPINLDLIFKELEWIFKNNRTLLQITLDKTELTMSYASNILLVYESNFPTFIYLWTTFKRLFPHFHLRPISTKRNYSTPQQLAKASTRSELTFLKKELERFIENGWIDSHDVKIMSKHKNFDLLNQFFEKMTNDQLHNLFFKSEENVFNQLISALNCEEAEQFKQVFERLIKLIDIQPSINISIDLSQLKETLKTRQLLHGNKDPFIQTAIQYKIIKPLNKSQVKHTTLSPHECQLISEKILTEPELIFRKNFYDHWRTHATSLEGGFKILQSGLIFANHSNYKFWYSLKNSIFFSHTNFVFFFDSRYSESQPHTYFSEKETGSQVEYLGRGFISLSGALQAILATNERDFSQVFNFLKEISLPNKKLYILKGKADPNKETIKVESGVILEDECFTPLIEMLNDSSPQKVTLFMSRLSPLIHENYQAPSNGNFVTIKDHIEACLNLYETHFRSLLPPELQAPFKLFLCIHDIGKHKVAKESFSSQEKANQEYLKKLSQTQPYITNQLSTIYLALVEHDTIAQYLKKELTLEKTYQTLSKQAHKAQLSLSLFFKLNLIYYLCDAGSYSDLESLLSIWDQKKSSGRYLLRFPIYENRLQQLEQKILSHQKTIYQLTHEECNETYRFNLIFYQKTLKETQQHPLLTKQFDLPPQASYETQNLTQSICISC